MNIENKIYDVYYTTGGGPWVNAGTDTWVNIWMEEITPKLDVTPILLIHRNKPKGNEEYEFPIETHWHGDDITEFENICNNARRINILHGHYTPMKPIVQNKEKIHSNVLHNSIDHIVKSALVADVPFIHHPFMSSDWERDVNDWSEHTLWVGLYEILYKNTNIPNFYEFKHNLELSHHDKLGFGARSEGRKNPHYIDGLPTTLFTDSVEFNMIWKNGVKVDVSKSKVYHYDAKDKSRFYNMDWGISHSAFTAEPFGYSIFEAVDYGKLPILHGTWCPEFEYPYRASSKKEFGNTYKRILSDSYEERNKWFNLLKTHMIENYTDKEKWIQSFLKIYNQ